MIDLRGLDKAAVLAALYNASKPQGMGFLHYDPKPMTAEEAAELLKGGTSFDYLKGRVVKVNLGEDQLDPWGYDRDNGKGAAKMVIEALRATSDPNNVLIRAEHVSKTAESVRQTRSQLGGESRWVGSSHLGLVLVTLRNN